MVAGVKYYQDQNKSVTPNPRCCFVIWINICNILQTIVETMSNPKTDRDNSLGTVLDGPAPDIDVEAKAELFDLLGHAHMIPILHEFAFNPGPSRFSDLRNRLDVPQTTLTDRLQELTDSGFLVRRSYDEIPPRVEYTATDKTTDLTPMFEYLCRWAVHHQGD